MANAPSPFTDEDWIEYTQHWINAGILATLAGILLVVGGLWATSSIVVEEVGGAVTIHSVEPGFIYGGAMGALGLPLITRARLEYTRAGLVRTRAQHRNMAAGILTTLMGTVLLKTLEKATEEDDS